MKDFKINFPFNGRRYRIKVQQSYISDQLEIFTVTGGRNILRIQSNRPLLRKKGLNRRRINWKIIEGNVKYLSAYEQLLKELEGHIRTLENPPFNYKDHQKNQ